MEKNDNETMMNLGQDFVKEIVKTLEKIDTLINNKTAIKTEELLKRKSNLEKILSELENSIKKIPTIQKSITRMSEISEKIKISSENCMNELAEWLYFYNDFQIYKDEMIKAYKKFKDIKIRVIDYDLNLSEKEKKLQKLKIQNEELEIIKKNLSIAYGKLQKQNENSIEKQQNASFLEETKSLIKFGYPQRKTGIKILDSFDLFIYTHSKEPENRLSNFVKLEYKFPLYYAIALTEKQIFLTGGQSQLYNKTFTNNYAFEIDLNGKIIQKPNMKMERFNHSIISAKINESELIFVIGGKNNNGECLANCEIYDILENKWIEINSLNNKRYKSELCIFNRKYIYAFFGYNEKSYVQTIENYDICLIFSDIKSTNWKIIYEIKTPIISENLAFSDFGLAQNSEKSIILFGGVSYKYQAPVNNIFIFDTEKCELSEFPEKLHSPDIFNNAPIFYYENNIICIGKELNIHIFDLEKQKFNNSKINY